MSFCGYAQLHERENLHQLTRYADHPILEFLRPNAGTPNVDEILPALV